MPLDPSIIMRGTELQMAQAAQRDAQIASFFDKLAARRTKAEEEKKKLESDYEGSAYRVAQALSSGKQPDPDDLARAKAWDAIQMSQQAVNPATNEPFPKNRSIFDTISGRGMHGIEMPAIDVTEQITGSPYSPTPFVEGRSSPQELPNVFENLVGEQPQASNLGLQLPAPKNPKQGLNRFEAETDIAKQSQLALQDIEKQSALADVETSRAGAEAFSKETGEFAAKTQSKLQPINAIISELEAFGEESVKKLPGGAAENVASIITNWANLPNAAALSKAKLDSTLPYLMSQSKEIMRSAGEGTFTDQDQKIISDMYFNDTDSTGVKLEKFNTITKIMKRTKERITGKKESFINENKGKPGFKYLGTE